MATLGSGKKPQSANGFAKIPHLTFLLAANLPKHKAYTEFN
jgi:hypothetical protein